MDLCRFGLRQGWMDLNAPSESDGLLCFEQRYFFQKTKKKNRQKERKPFPSQSGRNCKTGP